MKLKKSVKRNIRKTLVAVVLAGGVYAMGNVVYRQAHASTFYPHTVIDGVDVSGMSKDAAMTALLEKNSSENITLTHNGQAVASVKRKDIASYDAEKTIDAVMMKQRNTGLVKAVFATKASGSGDIAADNVKAEKWLSSQPAIQERKDVTTDAKVIYDTDIHAVKVVEEHQGNQFDMKKLTQAFVTSVEKGDDTFSIDNADYLIQPSITTKSKSIRKQKTALEKIASHKITLRSGDASTVLDADRFMKYVSADKNGKLSVDEKWLGSYVKSLNSNFGTIGKPVTFQTPDGQTVTASGGTYGKVVDTSKEVKSIRQDILSSQDVDREVAMKMNGNDTLGKTFILVNIGSQTVTAYKDGQKILNASVVTGKDVAGRRTTRGAYYIFHKRSPAVLKGPGYASPVDNFSAFHNGQGFHNASWRHSFGGSIYKSNGSHGCVNMTLADSRVIYNNFGIGTPVIII